MYNHGPSAQKKRWAISGNSSVQLVCLHVQEYHVQFDRSLVLSVTVKLGQFQVEQDFCQSGWRPVFAIALKLVLIWWLFLNYKGLESIA